MGNTSNVNSTESEDPYNSWVSNSRYSPTFLYDHPYATGSNDPGRHYYALKNGYGYVDGVGGNDLIVLQRGAKRGEPVWFSEVSMRAHDYSPFFEIVNPDDLPRNADSIHESRVLGLTKRSVLTYVAEEIGESMSARCSAPESFSDYEINWRSGLIDAYINSLLDQIDSLFG